MKKRGQFFLIAALLISGITIGFGTLYNTASIERTDTRVYDLSEQLHSELQQVYDSGTLNPSPGTPEQQQKSLQENLQRLTTVYEAQNPDSNIVVFYGDGETVKKLSGETGQLKTYSCEEGRCDEDAEEVQTVLKEYRFGGIFGKLTYYDKDGNEVTSGNKYYQNPLAPRDRHCPSGYEERPFFGKGKGLADLSVCLAPTLSSDPIYDFGGMYMKKGNELVKPNPVTGDKCPSSDYQDIGVSFIKRGGFSEEYQLHWCYRLHTSAQQTENLLYSIESLSTLSDPDRVTSNFPSSLSCPTEEGYAKPSWVFTLTGDNAKSINSALSFCYKKGSVQTSLGASTSSGAEITASGDTTPTPSQRRIKRVKMNLKFNEKGVSSANTAQDSKKDTPQEEISKEFEMKPEQKFYIVVLKKVKNERVVVSR